MDFLYKLLIYVHVVSAAASIGPFFILIPVVNRLRTQIEAELQSLLHTFRYVVRFTKHAGHVLIGSGVLLVILGPWTWKTPWIVATLLLLFSSLFFLARAFSPTLRKFQEENQNREMLVKKLRKAVWIYLVLLLAMLWFMVVKPYM
ncbi:hypothetical protein FZW96_19085 [Bacillus sp. BGMRC 2118]|nr:hypothetical protein FZW96_19085 [Bacillus sp. BGMRC 2118]